MVVLLSKSTMMVQNIINFQMEVPLMLTCHEGDTGRERSADFLFLCVSLHVIVPPDY